MPTVTSIKKIDNALYHIDISSLIHKKQIDSLFALMSSADYNDMVIERAERGRRARCTRLRLQYINLLTTFICPSCTDTYENHQRHAMPLVAPFRLHNCFGQAPMCHSCTYICEHTRCECSILLEAFPIPQYTFAMTDAECEDFCEDCEPFVQEHFAPLPQRSGVWMWYDQRLDTRDNAPFWNA